MKHSTAFDQPSQKNKRPVFEAGKQLAAEKRDQHLP